MKIGWKLTLALVIPIVTLTLFLGYGFQIRSRELLREELAREGRAISRVVQIASEDYLRDRQVSDLRQLADRISGYERVFGVRLFDRDGSLTYQPTSLAPYSFEQWDELRTAISDKRTVQMRVLVGDQPAVGFVVPLFNRRNELTGAVQVLQLESYIAEDERTTQTFIFQLTFAMVIATLIIVPVVTRASISRPIARLVRSFREIGASDAPEPVPIQSNDELGWLSREFNGMCERLADTRAVLLREQDHRRAVEAELRNAERLAGLGRLAAGLAHEIGTPLNVILGRAESLQRTHLAGESAQKHLGIIVDQSERIARIVRDMLDFARMKPRRHVETGLRYALQSALDLLEGRLESQNVVVDLVAPDLIPTVLADPDQLQQVFLNLCANAIDAMPEGGRLSIRVSEQTATNPEHAGPAIACVQVTFQDTGTGIAPEELKHVFDPFYTTKDAGRGTGLGLSVSYGIIEEHHGWFEVASLPDSGASFSVYLPLASSLAHSSGVQT